MFDEPEGDDKHDEKSFTPEDRARDKSDEFRMHAEIAAVFEGARKYNAGIYPGLDPGIAREIQTTIARLEKSRPADTPLLPDESKKDAEDILNLYATRDLSPNDYHIHRRPGEVMIVRWLTGDQVDLFYARLQAHFDAALNQFRAEERSSNEWKQDPTTLKYLDALDALDVKMPDRYLREPIRAHNLFVLSTQSADEIDIIHLTDYVMGVGPEEIVGKSSAPSDAPTESERAWFFKLFSLRGMIEGVERMCFFTFLQKADEGW